MRRFRGLWWGMSRIENVVQEQAKSITVRGRDRTAVRTMSGVVGREK